MPTTTEPYYDRARREVLAWFELHEARWVRDNMLVFSKPGTGFYSLNYLTVGARLVVGGDLGNAVYEGTSDLHWWADCHLGYFAGKCVASEHGRGYKTWEPEYAKETLEHLAGQGLVFESSAWEAIQTQFDWHQWVGEHGPATFGSDYYEYSGIGTVIDRRCMGHLYGLKLALNRLEGRPLPEWMR